MDLVFRDHLRPQRMVEITARSAGFKVIDQNARTTHERGGYLLFFGIVGADGGNEASLEDPNLRSAREILTSCR